MSLFARFSTTLGRNARSLILALALVTPAAVAYAQATASGADALRLRHRVQVLTAPQLAGRGAGTPEAQAVADTVAAWLAACGLQPAFAGSWFQDVPLSGEGWTGNDLSGAIDRNVAGILAGAGRLHGRYVVVGAHYDHLGRLDPLPADAPPPASGQYYPGANDNASGVAALLELAGTLAQSIETDETGYRSVLFVSFAAEEAGLQGSRHLAAHLPVPRDSIDVMINFDTIGRLRENRLYVSGVATAEPLTRLVRQANDDGLDLVEGRGGWSGSDHMVFNTLEIPVLFLFSGPYAEYNRPSDDWPTLDYEGLARISRYTTGLVELLRREQGDLTWVRVGDADLRPATGAGQNRDTWFGSLPDFTEGTEGYRLAGVFDDSPAARAGLQKGDVLVRLGGQDISDLAGFTVALRTHAPGDLVEVTVLRQGKSLNFTVVLGNRQDRK